MTDVRNPLEDEKLVAETVKLAADARQAEALAAKADAEVRLLTEQARKAAAEARQAELQAQHNAIELASLRRIEAAELAKDEHHRVYQFNDPVTASSVKTCIAVLSRWDRIDPDCPIELVFNSPGGSVIDGFALWDFLTTLKHNHRLTTVCRGMAASMAGILLQRGDVRVMGSESVLLVHEISFGAGGKIGEVEDEVAFAKMLTQRVLRIFAERTNLTARQIDSRWKRKDWWLDSDEALKLGFCDEVR